MDRLRKIFGQIPWASLGRSTVAGRLGDSLVPVGVLPFDAPKIEPGAPIPFVDNRMEGFENYLIDILGTAIQSGYGKLVTCAHVADSIDSSHKKGFILARRKTGNTIVHSHYPISKILRFIDPRIDAVNSDVDLAVLLVPAKSTPELPYETPSVTWGDSTQLGVGDRVMVGGYPLGTQLFKLNSSNRGFIQPTFYEGIVSSILPAQKTEETRLLQISVAVAGGMSGGAVFDPLSGKVLGMVFSGIEANGVPLPFTYAIPSEVIGPFVDAIRFTTK